MAILSLTLKAEFVFACIFGVSTLTRYYYPGTSV